jgi:hypothetical protein
MSDKVDVAELVRLLTRANRNIDAVDGTTYGDMNKLLDTISIDVHRALTIASKGARDE